MAGAAPASAGTGAPVVPVFPFHPWALPREHRWAPLPLEMEKNRGGVLKSLHAVKKTTLRGVASTGDILLGGLGCHGCGGGHSAGLFPGVSDAVAIGRCIFAPSCKFRYPVPMTPKEIEQLADLLKALGQQSRLSLVCRLCECETPQNAMCLCDCCSVDASGVSRHLKVLAQEGVLNVERSGRERSYTLNRSFVASRLRALADKINSHPETP